MKWIDAEKKLTITVFDEEHEEHIDKVMSVEEILDTYTNEGCPSIYSNPERKTGKWLPDNNNYYEERFVCSECKGNFKVATCMGKPMWKFCPNCGSYNGGGAG